MNIKNIGLLFILKLTKRLLTLMSMQIVEHSHQLQFSPDG